ncbi:transcriptional regulator [Enterococcus faecalis]|jgi:hypothetical protein|uniref:transcriptional regulator n=1 Tax=Enterococcus faecalis TaxID=1351 RepID=UPI0019DB85A9|nr:transcriptional regulator [Enterococcus faecalis]MDU6565703.1 transcriptional regulator [Enterococcus faecalis]HCY9026033.1 transcriptional regulator [Enterococcus faecalis]
MEIVVSYNKKIARKNARDLLKSYRSIARRVGFVKISPLTRMTAYFDRSDVDLADEDNRELLETRNAMINALLMMNDNYLCILYYSYFSLNKLTCEQIGSKMDYSTSNIEKMKTIALVEFAEAYQKDNLLIVNENGEYL